MSRTRSPRRHGELVRLDTFYLGMLKGVGAVWQITACDAATSYGMAAILPALTHQGRPAAAGTPAPSFECPTANQQWALGWSPGPSWLPGDTPSIHPAGPRFHE